MNMKQKNDTELAIEKFERFIESGYANYNLPSSGLINVALNALRAQQEREHPLPLTVEELKERVGKPAFLEHDTEEKNGRRYWTVIERVTDRSIYHAYGVAELQFVRLYDHEPQEARG